MSFFKDFFFLNLEDYESFGIRFPLGIFLIAFTLAMCAAAFIITYHKICISTVLRRMIRYGATKESSAKTLKELGIANMRGVRRALSRSGQLTFMVKRRGESEEITELSEMSDETDPEAQHGDKKNSAGKKISAREAKRLENETLDNAEFYIHPDKLDRAKRTIETDSSSWWKPAVLSTVFVAMLILFAIFSEEILSYLNAYLAPKS